MTQDTKTALLDCAERAVRARGFDGFSYADLAKEVGIRKASIHYHFPTKADLSVALMDRYHAEFEQICARIDAEGPTASDRLLRLIAHYRDALNEAETLCLCVSFVSGRESLSSDLIGRISRFRQMVAAWIETVFLLGSKDGSIRDVSDPSKEARATLALLEGAHIAARAEADMTAFDQAVDILALRLGGKRGSP